MSRALVDGIVGKILVIARSKLASKVLIGSNNFSKQ
jgi:hypothetical protein